MSEMPDAGENHCDAEGIGGVDGFLIFLRAAGLYDRARARRMCRIDRIAKGKKSIGGHDRRLE